MACYKSTDRHVINSEFNITQSTKMWYSRSTLDCGVLVALESRGIRLKAAPRKAGRLHVTGGLVGVECESRIISIKLQLDEIEVSHTLGGCRRFRYYSTVSCQ